MTIIELARLVQAMRSAQRTYFRTRHQDDLEHSKRLERELDKTVEEIVAERPPMLAFKD